MQSREFTRYFCKIGNNTKDKDKNARDMEQISSLKETPNLKANYLICVSQEQNTFEAIYPMVCICAFLAYREEELQLEDYSLFYETKSRFLYRTAFKVSNPLQENSKKK